MSSVTKNLQHNLRLTSICTFTVTFVLFVKTVVKASRSKVDWSNIRSHTKQNSVSCAKTKDVVEVLRTKGTSTDICLVARIFGLNAPPAQTRGTDSHMRTYQEKALALNVITANVVERQCGSAPN